MFDMTDQEILNKFLRNYTSRIKADQKAKGIYASGRSAKSLRERIENGEGGDIRGVVTGADYFRQQERGRGPTKNSTGGGTTLQKRILQWLKVKSFSRGMSERERVGLSWGISKKIHKRGTLRGRSSKYPGLDLSKILREEYGALTRAYRNNMVSRVRSELIEAFKE